MMRISGAAVRKHVHATRVATATYMNVLVEITWHGGLHVVAVALSPTKTRRKKVRSIWMGSAF
jgi:hypothetical protein